MVRLAKLKLALIALGFTLLGIIIGAFLFVDVQPRSFLAVHRCSNCLNPREALGLLGSVVVQKIPALVPSVVFETDKTIVMNHPFPEAPIHYVVLPKKDIKNAGEIAEEDSPYLIDAFAVMRDIIQREKLHEYRIITNGPGIQHVAYLHFHLRAELPE